SAQSTCAYWKGWYKSSFRDRKEFVETPTHGYEATREAARGHSPRVGGGTSRVTNHDEEPAPLAGLGRRVHHPSGRSGGHIRACPDSLVASRIHNRPRQALARHPNSRRSEVRFRGQPGNHLRF